MSKVNITASVLLAVAGLTGAMGASAESLEQRVERMERLLSNQVLMEQMQQMQQIRQELTELRGLVENQDHQINMIKQRQRNLYQDMDRRLLELESGKSASGALAMPGSPVATTPISSGIAAPGMVAAPTQSHVPAPTTTTQPVADTDGKLAYSQAFGLLKEGRYQQAILAFRNFLQNFPQSKYSANALYWLGEANYVSRDYKTALQEFKKILSHYPESNKVQGAELKIGYTYYEMKDWSSARAALGQVISHYPNTTVARKAKERLDRMKREGH